eukprot:752180_1
MRFDRPMLITFILGILALGCSMSGSDKGSGEDVESRLDDLISTFENPGKYTENKENDSDHVVSQEVSYNDNQTTGTGSAEDVESRLDDLISTFENPGKYTENKENDSDHVVSQEVSYNDNQTTGTGSAEDVESRLDDLISTFEKPGKYTENIGNDSDRVDDLEDVSIYDDQTETENKENDSDHVVSTEVSYNDNQTTGTGTSKYASVMRIWQDELKLEIPDDIFEMINKHYNGGMSIEVKVERQSYGGSQDRCTVNVIPPELRLVGKGDSDLFIVACKYSSESECSPIPFPSDDDEDDDDTTPNGIMLPNRNAVNSFDCSEFLKFFLDGNHHVIKFAFKQSKEFVTVPSVGFSKRYFEGEPVFETIVRMDSRQTTFKLKVTNMELFRNEPDGTVFRVFIRHNDILDPGYGQIQSGDLDKAGNLELKWPYYFETSRINFEIFLCPSLTPKNLDIENCRFKETSVQLFTVDWEDVQYSFTFEKYKVHFSCESRACSSLAYGSFFKQAAGIIIYQDHEKSPRVYKFEVNQLTSPSKQSPIYFKGTLPYDISGQQIKLCILTFPRFNVEFRNCLKIDVPGVRDEKALTYGFVRQTGDEYGMTIPNGITRIIDGYMREKDLADFDRSARNFISTSEDLDSDGQELGKFLLNHQFAIFVHKELDDSDEYKPGILKDLFENILIFAQDNGCDKDAFIEEAENGKENHDVNLFVDQELFQNLMDIDNWDKDVAPKFQKALLKIINFVPQSSGTT